MKKVPTSFIGHFFPIGVFLLLLVYGLFIHPVLIGGERLPVEVLVLIALCVNSFYLLYRGYTWKEIESSMTKKVGESIPVVMILLAVGVLIGSWIVSGTIPMLIYYGISLVSADWIYIFSFLICIVFSLLTGTSWGSAGTIGVVMMGIAQVYDANLAITAAAIVGGSFFGDKMSPLSDTTNVAALATGVSVYDHIKSMMYTTGPAAILAAIAYIVLSPAIQGSLEGSAQEIATVQTTLADLKSIFNFNVLLLIPLIIVLWGSMTGKPIILTLLGSAWCALILALLFQNFSVSDVFQSFNKGFTVSMAEGVDPQSKVLNILNRGGLYNLIEGVVICLLIFGFIGTLDVIQAIKRSLEFVMQLLKKRWQTVSTALTATFLTNITASNQYATSFIIGSAFNEKFDEQGIDKKVLSRSLEDAGTMMENLFPWTPSGIFMFKALGVSTMAYAPYQFLSLSNFVIAYIFAFTGYACFYKK